MQCPVCKTVQLAMSHRENVEIDYCPQCRGVWLDRGELDKIIEQSQREPSSMQSGLDAQAGLPRRDEYRDNSRGHGGGHHTSSHGSGHARSLLKRLFD